MNANRILPDGLRRVRAMIAVVLSCLWAAPLAAQTPYRFTQIDQGFSPAMDVNDNGSVVGWWFGPNGSLGYVWTLQGGTQSIITDVAIINQFPLYTAINDPSRTLRLNASGMLAGIGCPSGCGISDIKAATWTSNQGLQFLGSFDADTQPSVAGGVNNNNQVVGTSAGGGYNNQGPFIWSAMNGLQHLTGFNGIGGYATAINNNGFVVGSKSTGTRSIAFIWSAATGLTDIPDVPNAANTVGWAINDSGVVVGRFLKNDQTYGLFRWSASSGTQDLNAPAGLPELADINNVGQIVATITQDGRRVPYLFQDGVWVNLNTLTPSGLTFTLQFVTAISDAGWIVGAGTTDPTGAELLQGFVLIPDCATDISATTAFNPGPLKLNKKTDRYTQTVTLKNADGAIPGPVTLVLHNLSSNAALLNSSGTTACTAPLGSPYVNVNVGADAIFEPRERATVTLEFSIEPSGQPITFVPRILGGSGDR